MEAIKERKNPFSPDQPVQHTMFVGRGKEIDRIIERGMSQVKVGKSVAFFLRGEYGIGKTSLAYYLMFLAERDVRLLPIYVALSGCKNLADVSEAILQGALKTDVYDKSALENIKELLGKYVGTQSFFGGSLTLHFEQLLSDAPEIKTHHGILKFLAALNERVQKNGYAGLFLVFDEINGIAKVEEFAHFLKGFWDGNAVTTQLPLLLMLCGVEERRTEIIINHEPVSRIFDVVDVTPLNMEECIAFYKKAFDTAKVKYEHAAIETMAKWSSGYPKIMHIIGDTIFWGHTNQLEPITAKETQKGILLSAESIGRKYFVPNVLTALQTSDYKSILKKLVDLMCEKNQQNFVRAELAEKLSATERKKLDNFLRKMRGLKAFVHLGQGVYGIPNRMIWIYLAAHYGRDVMFLP